MSRRSNAIAASRNFRSKIEAMSGSGAAVVSSPKMGAEELRNHLMIQRRGGYQPGKRKDQQKGGGNSRRYALA